VQEFMEDGNLFPGIHQYSFSNFKEQFVYGFATSTTRSDIYDKFCEWLKMLVDILPPTYIWLDGSYLTSKCDPNDIDLVVFYRPDEIVSIGQTETEKLAKVIRQLAPNYSCDAYFCYTLEHLTEQEKAQLNGQERIMQTYWMGQFCFDRGRKPKGIIELNREEILRFGGVKVDIASGQN
jgi:hypothetical protein